jgi:hypothetical protein
LFDYFSYVYVYVYVLLDFILHSSSGLSIHVICCVVCILFSTIG